MIAAPAETEAVPAATDWLKTVFARAATFAVPVSEADEMFPCVRA